MKLLASQWAGSWEVYHRKRLHLTSKIIKRKCHCPTHNDFSLNKKICKRNQNDYIGHLFIKFAILLVSSSRMLVWSTADLMNSIGEKNLLWGLPGVRSLENLYDNNEQWFLICLLPIGEVEWRIALRDECSKLFYLTVSSKILVIWLSYWVWL